MESYIKKVLPEFAPPVPPKLPELFVPMANWYTLFILNVYPPLPPELV